MKKFTSVKLIHECENIGDLKKKVEINFPNSHGHAWLKYN